MLVLIGIEKNTQRNMVPQLIHSMISILTAKTTNSGSLQMIKYVVIVIPMFAVI